MGRGRCQRNFHIDTAGVSFVFCGSFEYLTQVKTEREAEQSIGFGARLGQRDNHRVYEMALQPADLVSYAGMRQELAGRINQIVQLSPMKAEDFRAILADKQISPLHKLERQYGVKLRLEKRPPRAWWRRRRRRAWACATCTAASRRCSTSRSSGTASRRSTSWGPEAPP